jgi:hypothetical protein
VLELLFEVVVDLLDFSGQFSYIVTDFIHLKVLANHLLADCTELESFDRLRDFVKLIVKRGLSTDHAGPSDKHFLATSFLDAILRHA